MIANVNGITVQGTPEEIKHFIDITSNKKDKKKGLASCMPTQPSIPSMPKSHSNCGEVKKHSEYCGNDVYDPITGEWEGSI